MNERLAASLRALLQKTRNGSVQWLKGGEGFRYSKFTRASIAGAPYFTQFGGKHLAVYEIEFTAMTEDGDTYPSFAPVIEFISAGGELEWRWPFLPEAQDLLEAVRYQSAGVEDFLADVLGKEHES